MPRFSDHLVKSAIRLDRQSTTVPNTSNTSAFTAETSDMRAPRFNFVIPGWSEGPDPESRDSPMCNCTSEVRRFASPRNDRSSRFACNDDVVVRSSKSSFTPFDQLGADLVRLFLLRPMAAAANQVLLEIGHDLLHAVSRGWRQHVIVLGHDHQRRHPHRMVEVGRALPVA